jgi:hypothetical protein
VYVWRAGLFPRERGIGEVKACVQMGNIVINTSRGCFKLQIKRNDKINRKQCISKSITKVFLCFWSIWACLVFCAHKVTRKLTPYKK